MIRRVWVLISVLLTAPAWAQDEGQPPATPAAASPLDAVRSKTVIADEDRAVLRQWISEKVNAIAAGGVTSLAALRDEGANGSDAFKEAFQTLTFELVEPALGGAKLGPAAQLLAHVASLESLNAHKLLLKSLSDERVAIRTVAAAGLRNLRSKIAGAGGSVLNDTIEALRTAGKTETSTPALETIYEALNFAGAGATLADSKPAALAVLDILATRATDLQRGEVRAEAADAVGMKLAASLQASLGDPEKQRLLEAVAGILRYSVLRYAADLHREKVRDKIAPAAMIQLRNSTEHIIELAESQLAAALNPPTRPNITDAMSKDADTTKMKNQLNEWAELLKTATGKDFGVGEATP